MKLVATTGPMIIRNATARVSKGLPAIEDVRLLHGYTMAAIGGQNCINIL